MEGGKFPAKNHPEHWYPSESGCQGPVWNYWWHIDKCETGSNRGRFTPGRIPKGQQWNKFIGYSQTRIDGQNATLKITATKDEFRIKVENGRAKAFTELHGRNVWLTYMFTETVPHKVIPGWDVPKWTLLIGEDVQTGKRIMEFRDPEGRRERAGWTEKRCKDQRRWYSEDQIAEFRRRWTEEDFSDNPNLGYVTHETKLEDSEPDDPKPVEPAKPRWKCW